MENLHLAPSQLDLTVAEVLMQHTKDRAGILSWILHKSTRPREKEFPYPTMRQRAKLERLMQKSPEV